MPRWFQNELGLTASAGGKTFTFTPAFAIAGRMNGIAQFQDSDAEIVAGIRGVREITEQEFTELGNVAERTQRSRPSSPLGQVRPIETLKSPALPMSQKVGVVSVEPKTGQTESPSERLAEQLPEPSEVIRVERVASPDFLIKEEDRELAVGESGKGKRRRNRGGGK
jgi:hypothetical protein